MWVLNNLHYFCTTVTKRYCYHWTKEKKFAYTSAIFK
jgi:hypothetical protein